MPTAPPHIRTQQAVATGRTDIELDWDNHRPLVLELKVADPPEAAQVTRYLQTGALVAAIARSSSPIALAPHDAPQFLGVITWRRIRDLWWDDAPLALRQLHHLIDTLEVAMPRLTLPALTGITTSWDAWTTLADWSYEAAEAVAQRFSDAGFVCVLREGPKGRVLPPKRNEQRYTSWLWPAPWRADELSVLVGLFVGRPGQQVRVEGMPDLLLALYLDPNSPLGRALREDRQFTTAVQAWLTDGPHPPLRQYRPEQGIWEILHARASAVDLLTADDQSAAFVAWMDEAARAWVDAGVIARLADLERETRPLTGTEDEPA